MAEKKNFLAIDVEMWVKIANKKKGFLGSACIVTCFSIFLHTDSRE